MPSAVGYMFNLNCGALAVALKIAVSGLGFRANARNLEP